MRPTSINSKYIYHPPGDVESKEIDDRIFFSDANITQMTAVKEYETQLENEDYDAAQAALDNSDVDYFGPYVLNLLENRLVAIYDHFTNADGDGRIKVHLQHYSDTEPTAAEITTSQNVQAWIDDKTNTITSTELEAGTRYFNWISP